MLKTWGLIIIGIAALNFIRRRSLRYLSALQQDEYSPARFMLWYGNRKAFDTRASVIIALVIGATLILMPGPIWSFSISVLTAALLIWIAQTENDPRFGAKVKLVMTARARKIYGILLALNLILVIAAVSVSLHQTCCPHLVFFLTALILLFQVLPLLLVIVTKALQPAEKALQDLYLKEARQIIKTTSPYIIGITGSYGKTSTKNALGEILQTTLGSTFWPQKGVNTLMGNTREIREHLNPAIQYFVIEMGAYRQGSIEKLCNLAPPKAGIITAIGLMHLERFGDKENIYKAKTELARAIPQDGILVCNGDNPGARRAATEYPKKTTLLYGFDSSLGHLDCEISNIETSLKGTTFNIRFKDKTFAARTGMLGKPALSNLMATFAMSCALGSDPRLVLGAFSNLKPVDNRLSLDVSGDVIYLRDAYNSNPSGFEAALEVLGALEGRRKILMTPGMIELGEMQAEENRAIAEKAGTVCDIVIFVGSTNSDAFIKGLSQAGFKEENLFLFDHRDQALKKLSEIQAAGDVILIENDLPDWYEDSSRF